MRDLWDAAEERSRQAVLDAGVEINDGRPCRLSRGQRPRCCRGDSSRPSCGVSTTRSGAWHERHARISAAERRRHRPGPPGSGGRRRAVARRNRARAARAGRDVAGLRALRAERLAELDRAGRDPVHERGDDARRGGRRARATSLRVLHRARTAPLRQCAVCCSRSRGPSQAGVGAMLAVWGIRLSRRHLGRPDGRGFAAAGRGVPAAVDRRRC